MNTKEFFSENPPLTMFESWQIKNGLKKYLRPKDFAIKKYLDLVGYKNSKVILDYGCANGVWLERILKETPNSKGIGVDIAGELIAIANKRKNKKGNYFDTSLKWTVKDDSVDFCFSFDVVEHLRNRNMELKRISKVIKKGGKLLIFTLNPNNKYTFDWFFELFGSDWLYKRSDHLKSRFISPENLLNELKKNGFKKVGYELYPGPLNLFLDVFCYGALKILESIFGDKIEKILNLNSKVVEFVFNKNLVFDRLINIKGYSNGYFLWAQK